MGHARTRAIEKPYPRSPSKNEERANSDFDWSSYIGLDEYPQQTSMKASRTPQASRKPAVRSQKVDKTPSSKNPDEETSKKPARAATIHKQMRKKMNGDQPPFGVPKKLARKTAKRTKK